MGGQEKSESCGLYPWVSHFKSLLHLNVLLSSGQHLVWHTFLFLTTHMQVQHFTNQIKSN